MIQIRIQNEEDLYNRYDPTQTRINDEVYRYLRSFCTEMESKKHLHDTLQIISDKPIDTDRAKRAIREAVQRDQDEFDRQIALNHKRALVGYAVGIVLSIIGFLLAFLLDQVLLELISFLGTLAIRDAFTIHTKLNPDLKRLKSLLDPFLDFKLEVVPEQTEDGKTTCS